MGYVYVEVLENPTTVTPDVVGNLLVYYAENGTVTIEWMDTFENAGVTEADTINASVYFGAILLGQAIIIDNGDGIILSGSHNTIKHNTITNHERDLTVWGSSFNDGIILKGAIENIITNNVILNNSGIGIDISIYGVSKNNTFYHNNFINNSQNVRDYHNSTWDNGSSGNYWDDYNGLDKNNDGIGDTPYDIPGGDNKDYFPLMIPYDGTIRIKEFYVDDEALYTMLIIGMIAAILFCLPIAYIWYRKYYKIK